MDVGFLKKLMASMREDINNSIDAFENQLLQRLKEEANSGSESSGEDVGKKRARPVSKTIPKKPSSKPVQGVRSRLTKVGAKKPKSNWSEEEEYNTNTIGNLVKTKEKKKPSPTPTPSPESEEKPKSKDSNFDTESDQEIDYSQRERNKENINELINELKNSKGGRPAELLSQFRALIIDNFEKKCIDLLKETDCIRKINQIGKAMPDMSEKITKTINDLKELVAATQKNANDWSRVAGKLRNAITKNSYNEIKTIYGQITDLMNDKFRPQMKECMEILKDFCNTTRSRELREKGEKILDQYDQLKNKLS